MEETIVEYSKFLKKQKTVPQNKFSQDQAEKNILDDYDYLGNSCSVTDCTGLIPAPPRNHAEEEAYEDLFHYQPQPAPKN